MEIRSSAFTEGASIPSKFSRDGGNISPPLEFTNVPAGTQSLVLIMDDPDAPRGTFTHWVIYNSAPDETEFAENDPLEEALLGANDWGERAYGGPRPPSGEHRYFLHLYALDQELKLSEGVKRNQVLEAVRGHVLAEAQLMGRYAAARAG